jgi:hypothetical protein
MHNRISVQLKAPGSKLFNFSFLCYTNLLDASKDVYVLLCSSIPKVPTTV